MLDQKTPAMLSKIRSGQHDICLSKDMYSDQIDRINVSDEISTDVFLELQADYGTIGIVAKPDAEITIDGNSVGSDNYFARLIPGKHKIVVSKERYYPQERTLEISKGQEEKINIQLKPIVGSLSVMVDPPETEIYINKKYYGTSPKIIDSLLIGKYDLELTKEGYAIYKKQLVIEETKIAQVNSVLQKGKLIELHSYPEGAKIYYNDSLVGVTPAEIIVKDGSNKLILKKEYFVDKEAIVNASVNNQSFIFNLDVDHTVINFNIETVPNRARVFLNEHSFLDKSTVAITDLPSYFGTSPHSFQIPKGKYYLKVEKRGYKTIGKEIIIEKEDKLEFNLEPLKYRNKGTGLILSSLWPGAGQSYLKRGSAHFLMGFAFYGLISYSIYQHTEAVKNYDLYLVEIDEMIRESLKNEYQKNLDLSKYSMYAGAAIWGLNFVWTLATKSEAKKCRNVKFSVLSLPNSSSLALAMHYDF
jgi:hypothetical protein